MNQKRIEAKDYELLLGSLEGKLVLKFTDDGTKQKTSTARGYNAMSITRRAADPFTWFRHRVTTPFISL